MLRDISLHIAELARNSVKAGADTVHITVSSGNRMLCISVEDNGHGMKSELMQRAGDPFAADSNRGKICFGLSLFKYACEQSGGAFHIESVYGKGTSVSGELEILNIDRPPLGDVGECIKALSEEAPEVSFLLELSSHKGYFTAEKKPKDGSEISQEYKKEINRNVQLIFGGVLNEIVS